MMQENVAQCERVGTYGKGVFRTENRGRTDDRGNLRGCSGIHGWLSNRRELRQQQQKRVCLDG